MLDMREALRSAAGAFAGKHEVRRPTQAELAKAAGLTEHRFSQIISGALHARTEDAARILWVLNFMHRPRVGPSGRPLVDPISKEPITPEREMHTAQWVLETLQRSRVKWLEAQMSQVKREVSSPQIWGPVDETGRIIRSSLEERSGDLMAALKPAEA